MKILKIIAIIALVALVGIQFVPTERNQSDTTPQTDFMAVYSVPNEIQNKLQVSCYDCHSNNTQYPWYNKVQPLAWFLEDHIKEGKAELNFNEWGDYSGRRKTVNFGQSLNNLKVEKCQWIPIHSSIGTPPFPRMKNS